MALQITDANYDQVVETDKLVAVLIVDILYNVIDPRIKLKGAKK